MTPSIPPLWERLAEGRRALAEVRAAFEQSDEGPRLDLVPCAVCTTGATSTRAIAIHNSRCADHGERVYRAGSAARRVRP